MITCKLTGNIGKGIKAHIIPKAFYEIPPQEEGTCRLLSNVKDSFPKKTPIGIWDDGFVTKEGEDIFETWDDYSVRILVNETDKFNEVKNGGEIVAWSLSNYDYSKLKLFGLSILWRAHASTHPAFSKVSLGPHEEPIKNMLLSNQAGNPKQYSITIARWLANDFDRPIFLDPTRQRHNGVNYQRVYCGRYIFEIKTDQRPTVDGFHELQLKPDNELKIFAHELEKSKEWPLMKKIVEENRPLLPDSVKPS
jgi:hypothetical protein